MAGERPRKIEGWVISVGLNLVTGALVVAAAWGTFTGSTPAKIDGLRSTVEARLSAIDARISAQQRDADGIERRAGERADRIEARLYTVEQRRR